MKKKGPPINNPPTGAATGRETIVHLIPFLILPVLYCLGAAWPGYYTWGLNIWSVFVGWPAFVIPALGLLIMLPGISDALWNTLGSLLRGPLRLCRNSPRWVGIAAVSAVLLLTFFRLRSHALIYGDGYLMLGILSTQDLSSISGQGHLQVLSIIVGRLFISLATGIAGITPENALALFNSVGGVVGVWALYAVSLRLSTDPPRRAFMMAVALTSGAAMLFFGYIENYTWGAALGLWTIFFSLGYVQRKNGAAPVLVFALLAFLSHAITLPFLGAALMALSIRDSKGGRLMFGLTRRRAIWIVGIGSLAGITVLQLTGILTTSGLPHIFVPVWPQPDNPYWFLSPEHVGDLLNLLLLLAPLGVTLSVFCFMSRKCRLHKLEGEETILGALSLLTFVTVFWIDPELGAVRDWDLLSIVGFPLSLWAAYRFTGSPVFRSQPKRFILPAMVVIALNIGPNLYEKTHADVALARLDGLLWQSPHYQTDYDKAFRCISWGSTLCSILSRDDLAEKYFHRRLGADRNSPSAWFNLGQMYAKRNMVDSSAYFFEEAVRLDTDNYLYNTKLAGAKHKQGKLDEALRYINRSVELNPTDVVTSTTKAVILYRLGRAEEALSQFRSAHHLAPEQFDQNYNLGVTYTAMGRYDSADVYLSRALTIDPKSVRAYEHLIAVQLALGRDRKAMEILDQLRTVKPDAPGLNYYRSLPGRPENQ